MFNFNKSVWLLSVSVGISIIGISLFWSETVVACEGYQQQSGITGTSSSISTYYPSCTIDERYNHDRNQPHYTWFVGQEVFQVEKTWGGYIEEEEYIFFSIYPELPTGLLFDSFEGIITGTPTELSASRQYTITIHGLGLAYWGYAESLWTFTAEVIANSSPLSFNGNTIDYQEWNLGEDINLNLPSATGGTGEIKYTISHSLPQGLQLQNNTIVGRADESFSIYKYDEHIEVQDCPPTVRNCEVYVSENVGTVIKRYRYAPFQAIKFHFRKPHEPERLVYHIDLGEYLRTVPSEDIFNNNYEEFYSIVDTTFKWKLSNEIEQRLLYQDNQQAFESFYHRNCPATNFQNSPNYNKGELYVNHCMVSSKLYEGNQLMKWHTRGDLNQKKGKYIDYHMDLRRSKDFFFKSFKLNSTYDYYWTATDEIGRTAFVKFEAKLLPQHDKIDSPVWDYEVNRQVWTPDMDVHIKLPELINSQEDVSYMIDPALPPGLELNHNNITGTITRTLYIGGLIHQNHAKYTWTARTDDGIHYSTSFDVYIIPKPTIQADYTDYEIWRLSEKLIPSVFRRNTIGSFTWRVGETVHQPLPTGWSADKRGEYGIMQHLPAGMQFDGLNSILYGVPEEPLEETQFSLTVRSCRNSDLVIIRDHCPEQVDGRRVTTGDSYAFFSIEILPNPSSSGPSFNEQTINKQNWTLGSQINLDLPEASGGHGKLKYYLSHSLPAGIEVNQNQLTGSLDSNHRSRIFTMPLENISGIPNNLEIRIVKKYLYRPWQWVLEDTSTNYSLERRDLRQVAEDTSQKYSMVGLEIFLLDKNEGRALYHNIDSNFDYRTVFDYVDIEYNDYLLPGEQIEYININEPILWWLISSLRPDRNQINLHNHDFWLDKTYTYIWTVVDEENNIDQVSFQVNIAPGSLPVFPDSPTPLLTNEKESTTAEGNSHIRRYGFYASFELPQATGGEGTITYRIEPDLFGGLEFDGMNTISGTIAGEKTNLRLQSTGDFITIDQLRQHVTDEEFMEYIRREPWEVYRSSMMDDLLLDYLPHEIVTQILGLFPSTAGQNRSDKFYLIAEDEHGNQNSFPFYLVIQPPNSLEDGNLPAVEDIEITAGEETEITLPPVEWLAEAFCYQITPELPDGLTFGNRTIAGTAQNPTDSTTYTYSAYHVPRQTLDTFQSCEQFEYLNEATFTQTVELSVVPEPLAIPTFGNETVTDQVLRVGDSHSLVLPAAVGGTDPLTYELTPGLPAGLTISGHTVSGSPTTVTAETDYSWTVTDTDNTTASLTFSIEIVEDLEPSFGTETVTTQAWRQGDQVTLALPSASGGDRPLSYELSPALPTGLTLVGHTIGGVPTDTIPTTAYTWTATDADGNTATLSFNITITEDLEPAFGTTVISDQSWTENQPVSMLLPEASGGDGTLTYELSPVLPTGLSLTDKTIGGSPSQAMVATGFVWTVTDTDGDQDELTFTITVTEDRQPSFGTHTVPDLQWEYRQAVTYNLPQASGGDGSLTYTLTPDLPQGLTLTGHTISGTTADTPSSNRYRWSVTDNDGDTTHLEFTIRVGPEAPSEDFTRRWRVGDSIWIIFGGYEDNQPGWTYSFQPLDLAGNPAPNQTIPTFLTNEINRILYGTPTPADLPPNTVRAGKIRWTATDPQGNIQQTQTLTWSLHPDLKPTFPNTPTPTYTWIHGEPLTNTWLPQAQGGDHPLTYTLTPPPPPGTQIIHNPHNNTNQITGTPTQYILTPQTYIWTATDNDQHQNRDTATTQIRIQVVPDRTPHFHPHQNTHNHLTIGHTYTNHTIQPQATGGNTQQNTQTYHISPPLPTGLTLNPTNGTITGTYTGPPQTTTHTWTYTDSDNTQPETIIAIITITIQHPPQQIATIQPQNPTPHPRQTTHTQTQPNSIPTTTLPETTQTTQPSNSANTNPPTPQPTIPSSSTQNPQLRTTETASTTQQTPTFTDTIGNTHQQNIQKLAQQGITQGCKPNHYCPNRPITRAEIATLLIKTLNLTPTQNNYFTDITDNTHQANINTLAHHQITQSCNPPHNTRYCPNRPITRAETATLLTRAFNLTPTKINYFADIAGNTHQANINTLAHHQITQGCHYQEKIHNSRYCPNRPITRAETATLLIKTQQHHTRSLSEPEG